MHRTAAAPCMLGCFCLGLALGQGPVRDPAAVARLQRAAEAAGLAGRTLGSVQAEGIYFEAGAAEGSGTPFTVWADSAGRVRWEFRAAGGTQASVLDGWLGSVKDGGGARFLAASELSGRWLEALPVFALQAWLQDPSVRLAPLPDQGDGLQADRVEARLAADHALPGRRAALESSRRCELFVGRPRGDIVRLRHFLHPSDDYRVDIPVDLVAGDFRTADGIRWPFLVEAFAGGRKLGGYAFDSVAFDVPLDESLFEHPAPAQ